MSQQREAALQVLRRIAEIWQIESDSSRIFWLNHTDQRSPGFDWWPGDHRVAVRVHRGLETTNFAGSNQKTKPSNDEFKVTIQTEFLKNVAINTDRFQELVAVVSRFTTSTYAWVYLPKSLREEPSEGDSKLWLCSSAYMTPSNIDWLPDTLAGASIIQPVNAQIQAPNTPEFLFSGKPDFSRPAALRGAGLDGILEVIDQEIAPIGQKPSTWTGTDEFEEFAKEWAKSDFCFGTGDPTGMTLETPFGRDSALVRLRTADKHPQLGHGLLATLQLPYGADRLSLARRAAELNLLEFVSWTHFPQLGCWHLNENRPHQDGLAFTLFVPNILYKRGLATNIALWFLGRARWAREQMFPDKRDLTMLEILNARLGRQT